ncbi:ADP-ribose pyrophosphatase YjhB (NUDIX family) [Rhizobium leguminosarum]|nr:ADP-ribose pyrophosphatase YjhB (NUDIX family) [Rhizobium leguminosarum]
MSDELKPWSVTASRITYEDRWIRVRSDDCVTADGTVIAPFHVLDYPDWINVVPVMPDGRVLLTREYRHGRREIIHGLVAGGVECGDSGNGDAAMAAARRELREETGYEASTFVKLLTSYPNAASHSNAVTSWLALGLSRAGEPRFDPRREGRAAVCGSCRHPRRPAVGRGHHAVDACRGSVCGGKLASQAVIRGLK